MFGPGLGLMNIVGFLLHLLAIWIGIKVMTQKQAGFLQLVIIAVLSYVVSWGVGILLFPLGLLFGRLAGFAVAVIGVGVATRFVLDTKWGEAMTVGVIAAIVMVVINWIF